MKRSVFRQISWFSGALAIAASLTACSFHREKGSESDLRPTYASIRQNILAPKCFSCHSGPGAKHHIELTTYPGVLGRGLTHILVNPGSPEESDLYTTCKKGKMPKRAPHLSPEELAAIFDWIKAGAPETEDGPSAPPVPQPSHTPEPPDDDGGPVPPGTGAGTHEPCDGLPILHEPGPFKPCPSGRT